MGFGWVCVEEVGSVGLNLGSFQILGCCVRRLCCEGERGLEQVAPWGLPPLGTSGVSGVLGYR